MYLEIPFVYMHERFILCMLRIHSKGKNNIAFVYDITLFILQSLSITYLGTYILKNMYGPCLCNKEKDALFLDSDHLVYSSIFMTYLSKNAVLPAYICTNTAFLLQDQHRYTVYVYCQCVFRHHHSHLLSIIACT